MSSHRSDLMEDSEGLEILCQVMADEPKRKCAASGAGLAVEPELPELFHWIMLGLTEDESRAWRKGDAPAAGAVRRAAAGRSDITACIKCYQASNGWS